MDVKSDSSGGKYEDYEDDTFYLELERWIVRLIDDVTVEEIKRPSKTNAASSAATRDSRLFHTRNFYDWSVCYSSGAVGPPPPLFFPAATASGTGVFIPQHNGAKFEFRDRKK